MITAHTQLCGIIGNPVRHSVSPQMHNAAYADLGVDFSYSAFEVEDAGKALEAMRTLGIRGLSVTVPFKTDVIEFLDDIDERAKNIGAVNTVVNTDGVLKGFNTDSEGCMKALEEVVSLEGKRVIVLGAGGAARAVVFGLMTRNSHVTILNRTAEKAQKLAEECGADSWGGLKDLSSFEKAEVVINTTTVGMHPHDGQSPLPPSVLRKEMVVHDIVCAPMMTQLLKDAQAVGAQIVTGDRMLLHQGVEQVMLFTGKSPSVEVMEKALAEALS